MSKTKLILVGAAIVVIVLGLWWAGIFGSKAGQGAAVATSQQQAAQQQANQTASNASVKADVEKIDAQLTTVVPLGKTPTKDQIASAATAVITTNTMIRAFAMKFPAIVANAKTAGSATPNAQAISDLSVQLSNAGSLATVAAKNSMATSSNAASLKVAADNIVQAQAALKAARADIQVILASLGIN